MSKDKMVSWIALLIILFLFFVAHIARAEAELYKPTTSCAVLHQDENGNLIPCPGYSQKEIIDWDKLVNSVIMIESGGNPNAYNKSSGAIGLMQITPIVGEEYFRENQPAGTPTWCSCRQASVWDEVINRVIGTWYLHRLQDHYGCKTIEQILSAYHGGIGNLRKVNYDVSKMNSTTRSYVKKVMREYNK